MRLLTRTPVAVLLGSLLLAGCTDAPDDRPDPGPEEAAASGASEPPAEPAGLTTTNDALAPRGELTVAGRRYLSACQLVTVEDVRARLAVVPGTTTVTEHYLDRSLPHEQFSVDDVSVRARTSCEVRLDGYDDLVVGVEIIPGGKDDVVEGSYPFPEDVARIMKQMRRAAPDDAAAEVTDLVARLERDSERFPRLTRQYAIPRAGLEVPYEPLGGGWGVMTSRGTTTVGVSLSSAGGPIPATERAVALADLAHLYSLAAERLDDPELSQSPAAAALGEVTRVGSTPLVEPCAVLDDATFAGAVGVVPNGPVERSSYRLDPGVVTALATCAREYSASAVPDGNLRASAGRFGDSGYASVRLSLEAHRSRGDARARWRKLVREGDDAVVESGPLRTRADEAQSSRAFGTTSAYFLVGPYLAQVTLNEVRSVGFFGEQVDLAPTDQQLVALVNGVAPAIARAVADARG